MSTGGALYTSDSLRAANAPVFSTLKEKVDPGLLEALQDMKFEYMTPVQAKVMSSLPKMNSDCLVQAATGTGKTIAFLLPAIQSMLSNRPTKGQVAILVIAPTRELALQIAAEAVQLVSRLRSPVEVHTAFGGTAKASTLQKFVAGDPKILVATPGRLNDYMTEMNVRAKFTGLRTLILDEADRMLDQGFLPDILKVLHALPPKSDQIGGWNGMCFSATIPEKMRPVFSHVLAKDYVSVSTLDTSRPPTLEKISQFSVIIPGVEQIFGALLSLLKREYNATIGDSKIIVFGTTANLVALYAKVFKDQLPLPVFELHSRLSQSARTRATDNFKIAKKGIMFSSDVIGRGMDFPDVSLVVQVGLPMDADAYTHRVGRTARAGKDGRAIILLTELESFYLKENRQFPIAKYADTAAIMDDATSVSSMSTALRSTDLESKRKAYSAYLGFMKPFCKKLRITPTELVRMANDFALNGMLCEEIPPMEKKTVGKMGLKGVPGLRYASPEKQNLPHAQSQGRSNPNKQVPGDSGPHKRLKHQAWPSDTWGPKVSQARHFTGSAPSVDTQTPGRGKISGRPARGGRNDRGDRGRGSSLRSMHDSVL